MRRPRNPYVTGRTASGPGFYGRTALIDALLDDLAAPGAQIVLQGPRRIGKSSLLAALQRVLPGDDHAIVAIDLLPQRRKRLAELVLEIAAHVTEALGLPSPDPEPFDARGWYFRREFLPNIARELGRRRLVLLLDELDALEPDPADGAAASLYGYLAQLAASPNAPSWIGAIGGDPRTRSGDLTALLRSASIRDVWVLDPRDATALACQASELAFEPAALEAILTLSGSHPWAVQLLCWSVFDQRVRDAGAQGIDVAAVEAAVDGALHEGSTNLGWWWNGLAPGEKVFCAAFAEAGYHREGIAADEVQRRARAVAPRLGVAGVLAGPDRMVERRLLERLPGGNYQFSIELIRRWVERSWSIREAATALDDRDRSASELFKLAEQALDRRRWPSVIDLCRQALAEFPEHHGAAKLLGQALIASGNPELALQPCQQAYDEDPDDARPLLASALIAHARQLLADDDPIGRAQIVARAGAALDRARGVDADHPELAALETLLAAALPASVLPGAAAGVAVISPAEAREPQHAELALASDNSQLPRAERIRAVARRVQPLFTGEDPPCGRYFELTGGQEWVTGLLYCFQLETLDHRPASLQVFENLRGFGGELWERAAHVLVQLSARQHAAIPRVIDGGFYREQDDGEGFAYIVSDAAGDTLADSRAMARLRADREQALLQFYRLSEALTLLHERGIIHRNLWPGAIDRRVDPSDAGAADVLRLVRFEMSILISNLLRSITRTGDDATGGGEGDASDLARRFYLDQGSACLACCPPERLHALLQAESWRRTRPAESQEDHRSDVYGLGMVVIQWFLDDPGTDRLGELLAGGAPTWEEFRTAHIAVCAGLERSDLPPGLRRLLRSMIELDPQSRLRSEEVRATLQDNYNDFLEVWRPHHSALPHLVGVLVEQTARELYFRGALSAPPESELAALEVCELMKRDLRGGRLSYSDRGFSPYVRSPSSTTASARYVLLGANWAWFAMVFEHRRTTAAMPVPQVVLVKYVLERHRYRAAQGAIDKALPHFEVFPWDSPRLLPDRVQDRPPWTGLLESVALRGGMRSWHQQVHDALSWLLRYQRVQLAARLYPFQLDPETARGNHGVLTHDRDRDRDYVNQDPLLALYARDERRRPAFVDFFETDGQDDASGVLTVSPDLNGRPDLAMRSQIEVAYEARVSGTAIRVRREQSLGDRLPAQGWIHPRGDFSSALHIRNQERALLETLSMGALLDNLREPRSLRRPWRPSDRPITGLGAATDQIAAAMVTARPFYALHGPPGAGKTTIAACAVERILRADRGARILIAAQSHYALDNLGERLLDQTRRLGGVTAVRVASVEGADKVSPRLQPYFSSARATEQIERIRLEAQARLGRAQDPPAVLAVLARWQHQVERSQIEIEERLERGANLVFATCGAATAERLGTDVQTAGFDRVIVEEAAKAWPTELLMPLVLGREWILIGDHVQLPAYRRDETIAFLKECATASDDLLQQAGEGWERYVEVFDVFKNLFERSRPAPSGELARLLQDPLGSLTTQFRMRSTIGELVSHAFYGDRLAPGPEVDDPARRAAYRARLPGWLSEHELVWIDMEDLGKEAPCWRNDREAAVVAAIAASIDLGAVANDRFDHELAVLAAYRHQVTAIQDRLRDRNRGSLADHVHTVDSFQGREAGTVVVSLVRYNEHDPIKHARRRLGHMAAPERLNVMLSRARQRLVIVGSLAFFTASDVAHWDRICDVVRSRGTVIPARSVVALDDRGAQR